MNRPLPDPDNDSAPDAQACAASAQAAGGPGGSVAGPSEDQVARIVDVIRSGSRFLVTSHSRPDGDAVGSMLAMGMMLEQMGKHADLVTADRVPWVYRGLPHADSIRSAMRVHGPYDAVILLECDGLERARLRGLEEFFLINIDHHLSGRDFGNINWIDCQAASVGEMVTRLLKALGGTLTKDMAVCLYTTLLTDTGGFCYGSTNASTFALAHELALAGADPIRVAQDIYFSTTTAKMLLLGAALCTLKREGRLAWLWITHEDMVRTNAADEDCEGIVNYAICISGIEAAVFLRELPERRIRLSLRSKGRINVAAIAGRLGGGGHENAAGCTVEGPMTRALDEILAELRPVVGEFAGAPK
jgi:bifunctional oligoribonuclease and PAP phosphatase NrnA